MLAPGNAVQAVFLDSGPLGLITQRPGKNSLVDACQQWANNLSLLSIPILVPEVADYEVRRELIRLGNTNAVARLEAFTRAAAGRYVPITTAALREAARNWAAVRNAGQPTAHSEALDGDAILAGQVMDWCSARGIPIHTVAVATGNISDLSRFQDSHGSTFQSALWQNITP